MNNKDYLELTRQLELHVEAIKGFTAIAEYLVASDCSDEEVIKAYHTMKKWIFKHE